jgi:hypothetical protein
MAQTTPEMKKEGPYTEYFFQRSGSHSQLNEYLKNADFSVGPGTIIDTRDDTYIGTHDVHGFKVPHGSRLEEVLDDYMALPIE